MDRFEFLLKEMTKEEFVEQEHPRDPSGQFTNKPGTKSKSKKESPKKKISTERRNTAKTAAIAVAGTAAATLAILALRKSSLFKRELDDIAKNVDSIVKELPSKPVVEQSTKKIENVVPKIESKPLPVKQKEEILDVGDISSFKSDKLIREVDETLDDATKKVFGVTFESKKLEGLDRVFSGRIKQGYWTDENFIDPLFSLNKLRKTNDITSADFNNVINFYKSSIRELNKELRLIGKSDPKVRNKIKKLKIRSELARYAALSATYKKSVYLGKINEGSDAIKAYRVESDRFFDIYTDATRKLDAIEKAIAAKPGAKNLAKLNIEKQRAEQIKERSEKIYKILNSDADTVLINTEELSGFKKTIENTELEKLASRYAKDYGVKFPKEMRVENVGLAYESKPIIGGKKVNQKEEYKKMLRERIKRQYKKKTDKEIEDLVEELSKKEKAFDGVHMNTKSMTAEQFDEIEHPRDPSGKFTDKPGGKVTTPKPKGSHGGYRQFSGRLPKNAAEAVEIQREKYKQKYPEASGQEITNKLVDYGNKKSKGADWHMYIMDREKYDKIQKQRMEDAKKSKINRAYVNGKEVDWRPPVNVKDSIREQSNRFRRDVVKYKSIRDAAKKFNDKEISTTERNAARLILTVGSIATALGIAGVIARRPKLLAKYLKPEEFRVVNGEHIPVYRAGAKVKGTVPAEARLFQLSKVVGGGRVKNPFEEVASANSFNKILTRFMLQSASRAKGTQIARTADELLKSGPVAVTFGPGKAGFTNQFKIHDRYIQRVSQNTKDIYRYRKGDMAFDPVSRTYIPFFKDHTTGYTDVNQIKRLWTAKFGLNATNQRRGLPGLKYVNKEWKLTDEDKFWNYAKEQKWIVSPQGSHSYVVNKEGVLFPDQISRSWTEVNDATRKAYEEVNKFGGWTDTITQNLSGIANKILALITFVPGTGAAMYYFSMDIKDAAKNLKKAREETLRQQRIFDLGEGEKKQKTKKSEKKSKQKTEAETISKDEPKPKENVTPKSDAIMDWPEAKDAGMTKSDWEEYVREQNKLYEEPEKQTKQKGYEPEQEKITDIDVTDAVALQVADDISNISQACKLAIDSGMPGSEQFEQINNKLVEMYVVLKDKANENK